jgi:hypothetical protein
MKTIKIRFVKNSKGSYNIQRKGWFKWKYLGYSVDMGYGGYWERYWAETKEDLLKEVLDKHYQVCKKHVEIIEHPAIKIY